MGKRLTLIHRLSTKIDGTAAVIAPDNSVSNTGLRLLANKLDAIGEALVILLARSPSDKDGDAYTRGYTDGRRDGNQEAQREPRHDMGQ
jgi:hypothetical protein